MPATYEPIATTTLGSNVSSFDFTSIPNTYTDLKLIMVLSGSGNGAAVHYKFNDSATGYSMTEIYGDGTTAASTRETGLTIGRFSASTIFSLLAGETNRTLFIMDVMNYSNTSVNKTSLVSISRDRNGAGGVSNSVGLWGSTNAITKITITTNDSTAYFTNGNTATLYGILKA